MRRLVFLLPLTLYVWSALDLHTWVRVPQVLLHLLEHHSDLGHHHHDAEEHGHDEDQGHNPFGHEDQNACGSLNLVSLPTQDPSLALVITEAANKVPWHERNIALASYSGSKWNPPRLG